MLMESQPFLVALALVAAVIPLIPLRLISNESLARARDFWLLLMLGVGTLTAALFAPPFAPIGIYFLWWWRSQKELPSLVTWVALGIFFWGAGRLPAGAWVWIPWAWLAAGAAAVGVLGFQWWRLKPPGRPWWNPYRPFHQAAWFGQRTLAGAFFALLLPFAPWWVLPVPLLGLVITSSWAAVLAGAVAGVVMFPGYGSVGGLIVALGAILGLSGGSLGRWRLLEWTPRGDSLDSLRQRWRVMVLLLRSFLHPAWWPFGYGPRTMEHQIIRWASRVGVEAIPLGHPHIDLLQTLYEYGLCGVAVLAITASLVIPNLKWGDPWSAAWVAGIVLATATIPFRVVSVGLMWLVITAKLASGL